MNKNEEMKDDFACWIINNNDKRVIVENETTGENKTIILKDLDIKIGNNFENILFFDESFQDAELILKINDEIHRMLFYSL